MGVTGGNIGNIEGLAETEDDGVGRGNHLNGGDVVHAGLDAPRERRGRDCRLVNKHHQVGVKQLHHPIVCNFGKGWRCGAGQGSGP